MRKCLELLGPGQWRRWALLVAVALVASGFEMAGAALILVLTSLVAAPDAPIELPVVGDVRRFVEVGAGGEALAIVLAAVAAFFLLRALFFVGQAYLQERVAQNAGARLAARLVDGYLSAPYTFHLRRNSSELIRNASTTVSAVVYQVLSPAVTLVAEVLLVAGLLVVLIAVAPLATVLAVGTLGPLVVLLLRVIHPRLKRLGRITQDAHGGSIQALQQGLGGIRDIRLLGREEVFSRTFRRTRIELARAAYLRAAAAQVPRTMIETVLVLFILGLFAISLVRGQEAGQTLPLVGLFAYVGFRLQPSLQKIVGALNNIRFSAPAINDLYEDVRGVAAAAALAETPGRAVGPIRHHIELRDVWFGYEGAAQPALAGVDLTITAGESIGVCGPTGGGKSTLVDVLAGLLEPQEGAVYVDGTDIRCDLRGWQRQIGFVSQSIYLLDGSIRQNIAFGLPDDAVDERRLQEALRLAQLEDFLASLPAGLDTVVGERGVRLSGGQRQRVGIARALYECPSVLVFDEGTSALDNMTEAAFVEAMERLRGTRTIVTVAHRLSTIQRCDRILVVEGGRIASAGAYAALLRTDPFFEALVAGEPDHRLTDASIGE